MLVFPIWVQKKMSVWKVVTAFEGFGILLLRGMFFQSDLIILARIVG